MPSSSEDIFEAILRFKEDGYKKLKAWKPPPGRWWVERYNHAIRKGYSEKFAKIYADQGRS